MIYCKLYTVHYVWFFLRTKNINYTFSNTRVLLISHHHAFIMFNSLILLPKYILVYNKHAIEFILIPLCSAFSLYSVIIPSCDYQMYCIIINIILTILIISSIMLHRTIVTMSQNNFIFDARFIPFVLLFVPFVICSP